jgi:dUTP pyrophosphatase
MIKEPDFNKLKEDMEKLNKYLSDNEEDVDFALINDEYGVDIKGLEEDMLNYTGKLELGFKKLNSESTSPYYNYESDSGFDLYSTEEITVDGLGRALIPTGLSFDIKDGYEIQVRSKSGLAINQGLMCLNSPGTVDSGYNFEIKVIIFNTNKEPFTIKKGMKVAQAVLCPVVNGKWVNLVEKENLPEKDRNNLGFGSTGI